MGSTSTPVKSAYLTHTLVDSAHEEHNIWQSVHCEASFCEPSCMSLSAGDALSEFKSIDSDNGSLHTENSGGLSAPSESSTDVNTCIVLRVECLSKYLLKVGNLLVIKVELSSIH